MVRCFLNSGSYLPGSERSKALDLEVSVLLDKGAVKKVPSTLEFYSHLFVIPKALGGFRPVLDLSIPNAYVHTTKLQVETVVMVLVAVHCNDWVVSIYLKDAYFQILVLQFTLKRTTPSASGPWLWSFQSSTSLHKDDDTNFSGFTMQRDLPTTLC